MTRDAIRCSAVRCGTAKHVPGQKYRPEQGWEVLLGAPSRGPPIPHFNFSATTVAVRSAIAYTF